MAYQKGLFLRIGAKNYCWIFFRFIIKYVRFRESIPYVNFNLIVTLKYRRQFTTMQSIQDIFRHLLNIRKQYLYFNKRQQHRKNVCLLTLIQKDFNSRRLPYRLKIDTSSVIRMPFTLKCGFLSILVTIVLKA